MSWVLEGVSFFRLRTGHCGLRKLWAEETRSCWFSPLWMWLWGANPWARSSDLPTPGDSTPTVLARRHWSRHQALGASCRTTADGGLPGSHWPEDSSRSSHRTQKKKKKGRQPCSFLSAFTALRHKSPRWRPFLAQVSTLVSCRWSFCNTSFSRVGSLALHHPLYLRGELFLP